MEEAIATQSLWCDAQSNTIVFTFAVVVLQRMFERGVQRKQTCSPFVVAANRVAVVPCFDSWNGMANLWQGEFQSTTP